MKSEQSLVVRLRPAASALAGIISVLHARAADVVDLHYFLEDGCGYVKIQTRSTGEGLRRLSAQLERRVDVLNVSSVVTAACPVEESHGVGLESWRVIHEGLPNGEVVCEATVKLVADGKRIVATRDGLGPFDALDGALRRALERVVVETA